MNLARMMQVTCLEAIWWKCRAKGSTYRHPFEGALQGPYSVPLWQRLPSQSGLQEPEDGSLGLLNLSSLGNPSMPPVFLSGILVGLSTP